jgi:hypothetical protein
MDASLISYLALLIIGTAVTLVVAAILRRSGQSLLEAVYPAQRAAGVAGLVSVGFLLFSLGVLALISTVSLPVTGEVQTLVSKLGVILLVLSAAYGLALLALGRIRDTAHADALDEEYTAAIRHRA